MKKTYISPVSENIKLITENMIATSLGVHNGEQADQWANKKGGWSCDDWSGANVEEEEF